MRKYGLIGKSLSHSFSPAFFTDFFSRSGIEASYHLLELDAIADLRSRNDLWDWSGFNVTIPYKESVLSLLDDLNEEARAIGAVNVIQLKDHKLIGHNTDAHGFRQSIKPFLTNQHERALVLGSGGASKAVIHVLKQIGLDVFQVSRNPAGEKQLAWDQLNEHVLRACKLVVNCTPLGTFPDVDACPALPVQFLTEDHLVVDLIYNPEKTRLLLEAEKQGAAIMNGASMLREQALASWAIWNEI